MSGEHPEPAIYAHLIDQNARRLAHATRNIDDPDDVYQILGSLSSALAGLRQSFDQLGRWHDVNTARALTDGGDHWDAMLAAQRAGIDLQIAANHTQQVGTAVDSAHQNNGRIAWQPQPARRLPPAPVPGAPPTSRNVAGGHGHQIDQ